MRAVSRSGKMENGCECGVCRASVCFSPGFVYHFILLCLNLFVSFNIADFVLILLARIDYHVPSSLFFTSNSGYQFRSRDYK